MKGLVKVVVLIVIFGIGGVFYLSDVFVYGYIKEFVSRVYMGVLEK